MYSCFRRDISKSAPLWAFSVFLIELTYRRLEPVYVELPVVLPVDNNSLRPYEGKFYFVDEH